MVAAFPSRSPWLRSSPLRVPELGPGLDLPLIEERLASVVALPEVRALVLFGSRARGEAKPHSDLDLVIMAAAAAEKLRGSRWHVLGHAHREGVVLYAA